MDAHHKLSRRETQIMGALYTAGELTVNQLQEHLPEAPTPMAIRAALKILSDKGLVKRRKESREFVYRPAEARGRAGKSRLQQVVRTFFNGSIEQAIGAYLAGGKVRLSAGERERLKKLIDDAEPKV